MAQTFDSDEEYEGYVGKIVEKGEKSYVVAYPFPDDKTLKKYDKGVGSRIPLAVVTFNLSDWGGKYPPRHGQVILLTGVEKFVKGWRARHARPVNWDSGKDAPHHGAQPAKGD